MVPALGRNAPLHQQRRHQGQQREDQCMRKRHQTDGCDAVDWKRQLRHRNAHGAIQHDEQPEKGDRSDHRVADPQRAATPEQQHRHQYRRSGEETQPETELRQRVADFT
ncbi:hypothetical protein I5U36_04605 [Stenotrophomonas maltophilia]|nr:hypothetical protein [Stenotrophomonas maltophilia]